MKEMERWVQALIYLRKVYEGNGEMAVGINLLEESI